MANYTKQMENYWNTRFSKDYKIWGENPSKTARLAFDLFSKNKAKKILIPGIGYGRNSKLFSSNGFITEGIEISKKAIEIGKTYDPHSKFSHASILHSDFNKNTYDAIYCFNVLHLFRETERQQLVNKCFNAIKNNGLLYFVVFSDQERSFGRGTQIEYNTFECKPDRPVHYFTEEDLKSHFVQADIIASGPIEDIENHKESIHTRQLRYICTRVKK